MIILVKRSVFVAILALVIGLNYFPLNAESALNIANNSQNITEENIENNNVIANSADDKLVRKTAIAGKKSNARSFRATAYCLRGKTATGG
jgi:hypothetical protein